MVSKRAKSRMREFITGRIEEASKYTIKEADDSHILVAQRRDLVENPSEVYVVLHNQQMTLREYRSLLSRNNQQKTFTAEVFYKDGEMFMVRLGSRAQFKGDDRSLKNYSKEQRDKMIHLRGLEKSALETQLENSTLIYYQPEAERLSEGLRRYKMCTVHFDYSHIGPGDPGYGFVKPATSVDYKIAEEITALAISDGAVKFEGISPYNRKGLIAPRAE